ncbi:ABC transporter substrate-binding protein [Thalassovita sp.]|uniref:MlaC/ttg2D family ABC transporter substrate-binding protein n=1 Tax=Thalassovita sp. TaxID=1979401 RepID=UPI002B276E3E|nr:ABC transporter substrate-binding protein [Thalassovita sp.]
MLNKSSRRSFLSQISATALAAMLPMPAFALSASRAKTLVDRLVADINQVIDSGKSENLMLKEFERIFDRYADVPTIARYALGVDARRASPAQLSEFTKVFQRYISIKYGKRFREFIGGKIVVDSARQIKSFIEVKTTAHLRGEAPFDVTFLVSDKSGSEKFFNMFIEGINMLLTERDEIGAMLDQRGGNIDAMIADLRKVS